MRQNWWEMPDFINWVNSKNIHIWFNSIIRPADQAIWSLPSPKLREVHETLSSAELDGFSGGDKGIYKYNLRTYRNLVDQQVKTWMDEAIEREGRTDEQFDIGASRISFLKKLKDESKDNEEFQTLKHKFEILEKDLSVEEREILFRAVENTDPGFIFQALKENDISALTLDIKKLLINV